MTIEGDTGSIIDSWNNNIDELNKALMNADKSFYELSSAVKVEELAACITQLHAFKNDLSSVYDTCCKLLIDAMGNTPEISISGGVKVEKKTGADRKTWQHVDLAKNIASRLSDMAVDMETGEVTMTQQEMIVKLLDYCAPSYWRVKELAKIGINADRFCETSEAKTNIVIRKAK
jgi:hypothetical protein